MDQGGGHILSAVFNGYDGTCQAEGQEASKREGAFEDVQIGKAYTIEEWRKVEEF